MFALVKNETDGYTYSISDVLCDVYSDRDVAEYIAITLNKKHKNDDDPTFKVIPLEVLDINDSNLKKEIKRLTNIHYPKPL